VPRRRFLSLAKALAFSALAVPPRKAEVMHWRRSLTTAWAAVTLAVLSLMLSSDTWAASKFKRLDSLSGYTYASVTFDPLGNLYGATLGGGVYGQGTADGRNARYTISQAARTGQLPTPAQFSTRPVICTAQHATVAPQETGPCSS